VYPGEYDGNKVKEWAGTSQWRALRADLARFKTCGYSGWGSEGFWALALFRAQTGIQKLRPRALLLPVRVVLAVVKKLFTCATHINLEVGTEIGPGFIIPHGGPVRIHREAKIGADCAIQHVCTIGAGSRPGAPVIGDHVFIGCHASILGPVRVGDCATVAANSLVIGDVPAHATAIGVPAQIIPGAWRREQSGPPQVASDGIGSHCDSGRKAVSTTAPLVPQTSETAFHALENHAQQRADTCALSYFAARGQYREWSWSELARRTRAIQSWLLLARWTSRSPSCSFRGGRLSAWP
jgi:serine O-acetyltransferase